MEKQSSPYPKLTDLPLDEQLYRIRHSLAHALAAAVLQLRPGSKLGFGPPIDDGFYYDFILSAPLSEADFPEIEKKMRHFLKDGHRFVREDLSPAEAYARIDSMGEPYKREYATELVEKNSLSTISFYKTGPFLDMCEGPHVYNTREIPRDCFKIRQIAGAYWRGNSNNTMMTRIYAWAFLNKEELDRHVAAYQLALERDHKKLGKELDLFVIDEDIGKGLPLWLPNGTVIREELEKLAKEFEFKAGYKRVATPQLSREELYYKTGHLPYYAESMYPPMVLKETKETENGTVEEVKESYRLRPMNCPHHHKIFAARLRSYRDLPLRLAEYGHVFRFEDSGALSGLLRVRGMCMNDAHIYCTAEQIKPEFKKVMQMHQELYEILGIKEFSIRLSTWDPEDPKGREKFINDPAGWAFTEKVIAETVEELGIPYKIGRGEGAFYGPKIDIQFKSVTGREETASTGQLDFASGTRLDLGYKGADNELHTPYIIHRAPLGTHERFIAFLTEHYGGAFPTWLAPIQVIMVPVNPAFQEYCEKIRADLHNEFVRIELDDSNDTLNKRLRNAVIRKVPNILVIGEREVANQTVTLRRYGQQEQHTLSTESFKQLLLKRIRMRNDQVEL